MAKNDEFTLVMVGDVRVNRDDPLSAFQHIKGVLREADFALGNLEGAHADGGTSWRGRDGGSNWKSDTRQIDSVESAGFAAMNVANNHAMDFGADAMLATVANLDRIGIAHTGGGHNFAEAHTPAIVERKGLRVAMLGYTALFLRGWEAGPDSPGLAVFHGGTSYEPPARFFEGPGRPPIIHSWIVAEDKAQLAKDIAAARSKADLVVCTFHWGMSGGYIKLTEYQPVLGHFAIDAGADLVFGHHPHVLQGVEIYKGRPILYSLGNCVFDSRTGTYAPEKAIFRCGIRDGRIKSLEYLPMLDQEKCPRVVSLSEGRAVIDVIGERSAQFGTRFVPQGDVVQVQMSA